MRIYVAGPLNGSGVQADNVREACRVGSMINAAGHVAFVPHINVLWHGHYPAPEESWLQWDFAWLELCDALVRIPGESAGSDKEVARAGAIGIPAIPLSRFTQWLKAHPA
jgi:hypothetical protein